jgi:hypothetical protein
LRNFFISSYEIIPPVHLICFVDIGAKIAELGMFATNPQYSRQGLLSFKKRIHLEANSFNGACAQNHQRTRAKTCSCKPEHIPAKKLQTFVVSTIRDKCQSATKIPKVLVFITGGGSLEPKFCNAVKQAEKIPRIILRVCENFPDLPGIKANQFDEERRDTVSRRLAVAYALASFNFNLDAEEARRAGAVQRARLEEQKWHSVNSSNIPLPDPPGIDNLVRKEDT